MAKQHSKQRHWCSELVSIVRISILHDTKPILGNLEEIGERSALILTDRYISAGSRLRIICKTHEFTGIATDCKWDNSLGFFLQIRLAHSSRWKLRDFVPLHFFSLRDALARKPQLRYTT
jgi:hypothetical protein